MEEGSDPPGGGAYVYALREEEAYLQTDQDEKAEVIEIGPHDLHWARGSMTKPVVIRLVTYVRIPRDSHKRKITRRAVFARDGWECQYCGARTSLTVDHVIPRSKGGGSDWENIVASCAP